ncbi:MAG: MFS transporter [Thermoplasmataceae archaeon]|jgi:predicted MFS family arabinose efflux permease
MSSSFKFIKDFAPLWENKRFIYLWSARLISRFGSALSYIILLWITFTNTGSAIDVAYVGLAGFLPSISIGIFSGTLVDRLDRRRVLIFSNLARSIAMGMLVTALYFSGFNLSFILIAVIVFSICSTFFGPGSMAFLPEIVQPENLADANGIFDSTESVAGIVGFAMAGVLILTIGSISTLAIDATSWLIATLFFTLIGNTVTTTKTQSDSESLFSQVREGLSYLRDNTGLLELTITAMVLNFLFAFVLVFLVIYSIDFLHGNALVYAILEALLAAGWGIGGLLVGRLKLTKHTGRIWIYSAFFQGGTVVILSLSPILLIALPIFFMLGIMQGILGVTWLSTVQAVVPERLHGRYFAIDNMVSVAAIPIAQIAGAILIVASSISFTFLVAGVASLIAGAFFLSFGALKKFGYEPENQSK